MAKKNHYVIQEVRRWDIQASSMAEARALWGDEIGNYEVEERTIVEQETGDEESMLS